MCVNVFGCSRGSAWVMADGPLIRLLRAVALEDTFSHRGEKGGGSHFAQCFNCILSAPRRTFPLPDVGKGGRAKRGRVRDCSAPGVKRIGWLVRIILLPALWRWQHLPIRINWKLPVIVRKIVSRQPLPSGYN